LSNAGEFPLKDDPPRCWMIVLRLIRFQRRDDGSFFLLECASFGK
jgi:hypothetical protein